MCKILLWIKRAFIQSGDRSDQVMCTAQHPFWTSYIHGTPTLNPASSPRKQCDRIQQSLHPVTIQHISINLPYIIRCVKYMYTRSRAEKNPVGN